MPGGVRRRSVEERRHQGDGRAQALHGRVSRALSGGRLTVTDGPFTEAKELVGGFAIVEVESDDEAHEVARQFMELHRVHWPEFTGECEVRPFEDM